MKFFSKLYKFAKIDKFLKIKNVFNIIHNNFSLVIVVDTGIHVFKKYVNFYFIYFTFILLKIFIIIFYCNNFFYKFIYIISAGLGFKKRKRKHRRGRRVWDLYIGNRHRLAYNMPLKSYIFIFKRSNIILFSNSKNLLYKPILCYRNARKELVFKIKGFYITRYKIKRRIARV